jgi:hypothetical protein
MLDTPHHPLRLETMSKSQEDCESSESTAEVIAAAKVLEHLGNLPTSSNVNPKTPEQNLAKAERRSLGKSMGESKVASFLSSSSSLCCIKY